MSDDLPTVFEYQEELDDLERVRAGTLEEAARRCLSFLRNIPGHRRSDDVHDAICVLGQVVAPRDAGEAPGGQGGAT